MIDLPEDLSVHGWRIDHALTVTHVFIAVLTVVAIGGLAWLVFVGRRRRDSLVFDGSSRRGIAIPLALAAFVFLVVDGHLLFTSARDSLTVFHDFESVAAKPEVLRLQVSARQWAWDARYAGTDGRFGTPDDVYVTTDIRVPVGRPVLVQLASVDVVHALAIPNLRVQVDAIPGRIAWTWFEVARPAVLDVACSQHCGVSHNRMAGVLHAVPAVDFDAWLAQESRYAVKMDAERAELPKAAEPELFPSFRVPPEVLPRGWGWPWEEGLE